MHARTYIKMRGHLIFRSNECIDLLCLTILHDAIDLLLRALKAYNVDITEAKIQKNEICYEQLVFVFLP